MSLPDTQPLAWDWDQAQRRAGVLPDGRFNAGAVVFSHPRALIWKRSDGAVEVISGADLARLGQSAAVSLRRLGVERGDRVAGLLGRTPLSFALPLGVWRLGAIYLPLFAGLGSDGVRVRLADSGSRFLVAETADHAALSTIERELPNVTTVLAGAAANRAGPALMLTLDESDEEVAPADTHKDDAATIMYTSGTTGTPKGCVIPHRGLISTWPFAEHCLALSENDLLFSTADSAWAYGLYTTGFGVLSHGGSRLLYEGAFDPRAWWQTIRELEVTHLASTATAYRTVAAGGAEAVGPRPDSLRAATSSGEPLNAEVIRWYEDELGVQIHDSYGLTEIGVPIANLRGSYSRPPTAGSMGLAVPGFDVHVVDDGGRQLAPGEVGRIAVRDHGCFLGATYWRRDAEWEAHRDGEWWISEDLARRDVEGRYWYVGRRDDMILTSGYNVGPVEIENALLEHPHVVDAVCVGEPDERRGEIIAAHVVLNTPAPEDLADVLRRWVGERLGWHCAPRRVYVTPELPRTETGKVRRRELRDRDPERIRGAPP